MAIPDQIVLSNGFTIPILYEDHAVLAIDKPAGWMLAPDSWDRTARNLHLALQSALGAGMRWARTRGIRYLRFIHRLDADTSGVLLLAKSAGALRAYQQLFESREVHKTYLAVVRGIPSVSSWQCSLKIAPCPGQIGRMKVNERQGKPTETAFRVIQTVKQTTLIEAQPTTGRTHQIRVHLAATGYPVLNDPIYGAHPSPKSPVADKPLALRAIALSYRDPFRKKPVRIKAPATEWIQHYGFTAAI